MARPIELFDGFEPLLPPADCFASRIGLELVDETAETNAARIVLRPEHLDRHGFVHTGVVAAAAETLASVGTVIGVWHGGSSGQGLSNETRTLVPVSAGALHFSGELRAREPDRWLWEVQTRDDAGTLCYLSHVFVAVRPRG